ncbi:MAG: hypothetical protein QOH07_8 [Mycobacterium sp.]|jgi:imidazolonepropionase-like amidohydrolase|nr:hypothetical protein [Mycobacterium sp.]
MSKVIFEGGTVLDGDRPPVADSTVVVEGERIVRMGRDRVVPAAGDRVVDMTNRTLMPGMITSHCHIEGVQPENGPEGLTMATAIANCQTIIQSGFTGYVSAGVSYHLDAQLQIAIDTGVVRGPRILSGSQRINTTAYVNDYDPWWKELVDSPSDIYVDGVDQIRAAVRSQVRHGARMIKIFPTAGRGFKYGRSPGLSNEELQMVVQTAHGRGAKVRAHCVWLEQIHECIDAGVDLIDHGDEIDEECIEKMLRQGTYWVPSMALPATRGLTDPSVVEADWKNIAEMLPVANDAGVKILAGDDYGVPDMPHSLGAYVKDLVVAVDDFGIEPLSALRWATRHGAEVMGLAGETGTVAVGALADLLVIDGDPSTDIGLLSDPAAFIPAVMKGGVFMKDQLEIA